MKYRFKSLGFRIIALVMGFSAVIAVFVAVISYYISIRYLKENLRQSAYINLQLIGSEINTDLKTVLNFSSWLLLDSDVENYLTHISDYDNENVIEYRRMSMDIWHHLNNEYGLNASHDIINRFIVSDNDGRHFIHIARITDSSTSDILPNVMKMSSFDISGLTGGYSIAGFEHSPASPDSGNVVLPLFRPVRSSRSPVSIGWIYVEISSDVITKHIGNTNLNEDAELYITFNDDMTYRYEDGKYIRSTLPEGLVSYTLPVGDISLSLLPSAIELRRRSTDQFITIILILAFISVSGIIIYLLLRQMINVPVEALLSKLSKIGDGDFSRDPSIEWNNELGEIGRGINSLSDNVHALIDAKIEDERTRQLLEYRILQSQINPHFMYNTLNTIKWMATIQGIDGIADISTSLSRLLKNISKVEDNLIPLKDEKNLLDDYFTIMKYRYGGTIELIYDIDDESLLDCMINRFSLQPIVENSIFHGIEPTGTAGRIIIHIFDSPSDLLIDITDNGIGMDEATLERILSSDSSSSNDFFKDVGISNVSDRIRFTFGDEYGLTAESKQGEYTTIHFRIPKTYSSDWR